LARLQDAGPDKGAIENVERRGIAVKEEEIEKERGEV